MKVNRRVNNYLEGERATSRSPEKVAALLVGGVVLDAIRRRGDGALSVLQRDRAPRVVPDGTHRLVKAHGQDFIIIIGRSMAVMNVVSVTKSMEASINLINSITYSISTGYLFLQ